MLRILVLGAIACAGATTNDAPTVRAGTVPRPLCRSDADGCAPELALLDAGNASFWTHSYRRSWAHLQVAPDGGGEAGETGGVGGRGRGWVRAALGMAAGETETGIKTPLSPTAQRRPVKLLLAKLLKGWRAAGAHLNAVEVRDSEGIPIDDKAERDKLGSSKAAGRALVGGHTISFYLEEFPKAVELAEPAIEGLWGLTREVARLTGHLVTAQLDIGTENQHRARSPIAHQHDSFVWQLHGSSVWTVCTPATPDPAEPTFEVAKTNADIWMLNAVKKRHDDSNHQDVTMVYTLEEIEDWGKCDEVTVAEGDVLYLPFGAVHQVHPSGAPSVTLRAGLMLPGTRYIDVLNHAAHSTEANAPPGTTDVEGALLAANAIGFSDAVGIASRQFYGLVFWLPIAGIADVASGTATPEQLADIATSAHGMLDVVQAALTAFFKKDDVTPPKMKAGVAQVRAVDFNKAVAEFAEMVAAGTAASLADPGQFADAMRSRRRHNSQPPFVPPTDGDGGMSDGSDADSPPGDDQGFSPAEGHATDEL